jgi:hypothetical protein
VRNSRFLNGRTDVTYCYHCPFKNEASAGISLQWTVNLCASFSTVCRAVLVCSSCACTAGTPQLLRIGRLRAWLSSQIPVPRGSSEFNWLTCWRRSLCSAPCHSSFVICIHYCLISLFLSCTLNFCLFSFVSSLNFCIYFSHFTFCSLYFQALLLDFKCCFFISSFLSCRSYFTFFFLPFFVIVIYFSLPQSSFSLFSFIPSFIRRLLPFFPFVMTYFIFQYLFLF